MTRGAAGALFALAACGRVGFDPLGDPTGDGGPGDDAPADTAMAGYPGPFDQLLVWYRMDDAPADGAHDDSGADRDGLRAGAGTPTLVPGKIGMAFDLPPQTYLRAAHDPAFDTLAGFTIAYWVNPTLVEWSGVSKAVGIASANSYELGTNPMGDLQVCTATVVTTSMCAAAGGAVPVGAWSHVAVTWTGSQLTLFRDGIPLGGISKTGLVFDTHDLLIGAEESFGTAGYFAEATFDDVRVYGRDLSAAEIAGLAAP